MAPEGDSLIERLDTDGEIPVQLAEACAMRTLAGHIFQLGNRPPDNYARTIRAAEDITSLLGVRRHGKG